MKIKFLGTSAGWPLPRLGCKCNICSSSNPKDKRTRSQLLVNNSLLLDSGIDTYYHLNKQDIDPRQVKSLIITHEHPDHTFGLWDLAHTYLAKENGKSGPRNKVKVFVHQNTFSKIRHLFFADEYKIQKIESEQKTTVEGLGMQLLPVNHTSSSFGVLISEGKNRMFYAPDMKSLPTKTFNEVRKVDLVIFDGAELEIKSRNHQTVLEGIELAKNLRAKKVYFTHIGHRTLLHKDLGKFVKEKGGTRFLVAYDTLEIIM